MKLIKLYIFIVLACLFFGVGNAYNHKLEDFKIDEFTIKPKERYDGTFSWDICFEISFPNVDHPDFDESKIENPMVYDEMGKQIAFDHWYPDDIYEKLVTIIRNEIKKHWPEMKALKEKIRKNSMNEETNMNDNIIVYVDPNSNNDYYGVNDFNTLKLAAKTDRSIHFYRNLDDFIQAFNDGYVSDEGYLMAVGKSRDFSRGMKAGIG